MRVEWDPNEGYIALLHNDPIPAAQQKSLTLTSGSACTIDYYFVAGDNLDQVVSGYRELTGKAQALPRWSYGFWQSRQRYDTQDQLVGVVKEYASARSRSTTSSSTGATGRTTAGAATSLDKTPLPRPGQDAEGRSRRERPLHDLDLAEVLSDHQELTRELDAKGFMYHRNVEQGALDWVGPGLS
ncbi:TIM-barrel domain-containing protein [Caulobacter segnis]